MQLRVIMNIAERDHIVSCIYPHPFVLEAVRVPADWWQKRISGRKMILQIS